MLPYATAAKGPLRDAVNNAEKLPWSVASRAVIDWLCHNVHFGSADVAVQRSALVYE